MSSQEEETEVEEQQGEYITLVTQEKSGITIAATDDVNDVKIIEEETEIAAHRSTKLERLEAKDDIVTDYLKELLDIADLDRDIEIGVGNGRALTKIVTDGEPDRRLYCLVGRHGKVLESLQELTRLVMQT